MAKIVLTDGVVNVKENYEDVLILVSSGGNWMELTEHNRERENFDRSLGVTSDYRIVISINHIQCIKP